MGDSYWETYSPVVNMLTVSLIRAIAKIHNLEKEILDHKNGKHWSIVLCNTLPNKAQPIKPFGLSNASESQMVSY